jgi:hypothetical protein
VYLDATRYGMPLRQIVAADGRPNHLACALRDLMPLAPGYDAAVLLYDRELEHDYLLVERVLACLGATVHRVALGRVPINGRIASARHGGWQGHTAAALLEALGDRYDEPALRLGMRLYFIATLGPGDHESFRRDLLGRCLHRAERMLAGGFDPGPGEGNLPEFLARHRGGHGCVDPYRLASALLGRRARGPVREVVSAVFT